MLACPACSSPAPIAFLCVHLCDGLLQQSFIRCGGRRSRNLFEGLWRHELGSGRTRKRAFVGLDMEHGIDGCSVLAIVRSFVVQWREIDPCLNEVVITENLVVTPVR